MTRPHVKPGISSPPRSGRERQDRSGRCSTPCETARTLGPRAAPARWARSSAAAGASPTITRAAPTPISRARRDRELQAHRVHTPPARWTARPTSASRLACVGLWCRARGRERADRASEPGGRRPCSRVRESQGRCPASASNQTYSSARRGITPAARPRPFRPTVNSSNGRTGEIQPVQRRETVAPMRRPPSAKAGMQTETDANKWKTARDERRRDRRRRDRCVCASSAAFAACLVDPAIGRPAPATPHRRSP